MKAKKRVVTGKATRPPGTKRRPTVRRIRPAIAPVPRRRGPPPPTPPASAWPAEPEAVDATPIDLVHRQLRAIVAAETGEGNSLR